MDLILGNLLKEIATLVHLIPAFRWDVMNFHKCSLYKMQMNNCIIYLNTYVCLYYPVRRKDGCDGYTLPQIPMTSAADLGWRVALGPKLNPIEVFVFW